MHSVYRDAAGTPYHVHAAVIDAMGLRTSEIYDFCRRHQNFLIPLQGKERQASPCSWSKIEFYPGSKRAIPGGLDLLQIDTNFFKNDLASRLDVAPGDPGSWRLHSETTEEWAQHLAAEYRDPKTGLWKCPESKPNHGWDCSTYVNALAELLNVKRWPAPEEERKEENPVVVKSQFLGG